MATVAAHELADAVRSTFNRVATTPGAGYRFAVGRDYARAVGYPDGLLDSLPAEAAASFTGLTYLLPQLRLAPAERVLDLGCGGGLDSALMARAVAPTGILYGVDLSEKMVARARRVGTALRLLNARFLQGAAEALPIASDSIDVVVANGFLNLCPDKAAVVRDVARVLRPEGRAVFAEISFADVRPSVELRTADDWFR